MSGFELKFPPVQLRWSRVLLMLLLAGATITAAALAPDASSAKKPAPEAPVTISPARGTPDANPETQISVLGPKRHDIKTVKATGSVTGPHAGQIRKYSDNRGASFLPSEPFAQGEQVEIEIRIKGRSPIQSSFTVAVLGVIPPILNLPVKQEDKLQHFVTEPELDAPQITVNKGRLSNDDSILITPLPSPIIHPDAENTITINPIGPGGPMIIDRDGKLVWFRELAPPDVASNLSVDRYLGKKVLTWWRGPVTFQAFGQGEAVIANHSYKTIATVQTGNGYKMDIHELRLNNEGDALVTIYSPVKVQMPGDPEGELTPVLNSIIQEIDVRTGLVVWEWHALGHIPLDESYANPENSASNDAFHLNSIQPLGGGRMLVSARNTSAIYMVDRPTGKIKWTLGGKAGDFKLGEGARFWFQHDARRMPDGRITMFDDQAGPPQKAPASRGLILKLDHKKKTVKVARQYKRAPDTSAQSEGSLQKGRHGGNAFVGYGATGFFTELRESGKKVFDANLPDGDGSYRTIRAPWSGTPKTRPKAAVTQTEDSKVTVYASWNGSTEVARWQILAGTGSGPLQVVKTIKRTGFETSSSTKSSATHYAVRALDSKGRSLGTTARVTAP